MTDDVTNEISAAIRTLRLTNSEIRLVQAVEAERIYLTALARFVSGPDRRWWWEAFQLPHAWLELQDSSSFRLIPEIVPDPDERVWFLAEDDRLTYFPVYEVTPAVAVSVIAECYGFEYYLIAGNFQWLVCENHHNTVFAVGELVKSRLEALSKRY